MSTTPHALALLQDGIDALGEAVARLGLTLVIERDFDRLVRFLESQGSFANPSYDPKVSRLGPEDFWLAALDSHGRIVASSAERVLETEDFLELVADGRIWYADGYRTRFGVERIEVLPVSTRLSGRISHSGSTYVVPAHRRSGLAMFLPWLSRALSFRNAGCNANTGFVRRSLADTPVPTRSYGYAHVEKCLDGWWPPQGGSEVLYLCWITVEEFLVKLAELPNHPRHPVPLPVRPRPRLAPVAA
ncbi:MAG: hypothetical protein NZ555_13655 [Geminicoccaceae bacterium]|nr:hypothetical protein [Geminicoccaceae bacterium]MCX8102119.1 hypothetical protein [Geminicoccaceae bacterium]MDW8371573.1 hypothetical protein [Geminicoccaceae bacterium]